MNDFRQTKSPGPPATCSAAVARLDSDGLFADKREVIIIHRGEEYRLRITRQEKLILTK